MCLPAMMFYGGDLFLLLLAHDFNKLGKVSGATNGFRTHGREQDALLAGKLAVIAVLSSGRLMNKTFNYKSPPTSSIRSTPRSRLLS